MTKTQYAASHVIIPIEPSNRFALDGIQCAHECFFSVVHAAKHSGIVYALAESVGLTFPLAKSTLEQYQ